MLIRSTVERVQITRMRFRERFPWIPYDSNRIRNEMMKTHVKNATTLPGVTNRYSFLFLFFSEYYSPDVPPLLFFSISCRQQKEIKNELS